MARDIFESIAVIPNSSDDFDEVWAVVDRANGRMIEKFVRRLDSISCEGNQQVLLDEQVFMDSTISYDDPLDIEGIEDNGDGTANITVLNHGFSSGDTIIISCAEQVRGSYEITTFAPVTNYWPVSGCGNAPDWAFTTWNGVEAYVKQACYDCTITKMVVRVATAPGTGTTRVFTLRKNGADTGIKVTLSGSDTTGSSTGSISFGTTYFDEISIKEELNNSPTESAFSVSLVAQSSTDRQVIITGRKAPTNLVNYFYSPILNNNAIYWQQNSGGTGHTAGQTATRYASLFSSSGTMKNYRQNLENAPYPTNPLRGKVFDIEEIDSSLSFLGGSLDFQILGTDTEGDSAAQTDPVTAGYFYALYANDTHAGVTYSDGKQTIDFIPTVAGARCYDCTFKIGNGTFYTSGNFNTVNSARSTTEQYIVIPTSGTIKNLYVHCGSKSPGSGKTATVTVRKNGVDTALLVTLSGTTTNGSNTSDSFTVVSGDLISFKSVSDSTDLDATAEGPKIGWTFVADNSLETPIFLSSWGVDLTDEVGATNENEFQITLNPTDVVSIQTGYARLAYNTFTGLSHLNGELVSILGDGVSLSPQTVVGGTVTLSASYGLVHIGLPYHSELETLNIELGSDRDTVQGRKIKVGNVDFNFVDSRGGYIGDEFDDLYEAFTDLILTRNQTELLYNEDLSTSNHATVLYTGHIRRPLKSQYRYGGRVCFRQVEPLPVTISSITPEVAVGGAG